MTRFILALAFVSIAPLSTPAVAANCTDLGRGMNICRDNAGNVVAPPKSTTGGATTGGGAQSGAPASSGASSQGAGGASASGH
ncbi:MAG: hypothetical protein ACR652_26690 [Methylocystis sp.]|uniref:hypothetical protein n=1 Tax=Methylocystis sp. TaxID=1911079 RepID=UPI003DA39FCC